MTETMTNLSPDVRKAAILVRSLDGATAARLLAELSPDEVAAVRAAILELDAVDGEERHEVWEEFRQATRNAPPDLAGGVELSPSLLAASQLTLPQSASEEPFPASAFESLSSEQPHDLAPHLAGEHPQTIAVVLAQFEAKRAADLLGALPLSLQADVVERLSHLQAADPESLKLLEDGLTNWLAQRPSAATASAGQENHAARILAAAESGARSRLLDRISHQHRDVADRLRKQFAVPAAVPVIAKPAPAPVPQPKTAPVVRNNVPKPVPMPHFPFEQLADLDTATFEAVLNHVHAEVLKLALVGADDLLIDRIARRLPRRARTRFRRSLHEVGPTRLDDVQRARQQVGCIAAEHLNGKRLAVVA